MPKKKLLLCGATGFIGRNLLEYFLKTGEYDVVAVHNKVPALDAPGAKWIKADLANADDVARALKGVHVVVQAAATTSGAKDIVSKPFIHTTDNAVMNSLIFRACHENGVERVVFFSCTVMYPSMDRPVRETDFTGEITDKYFGVGWTKVYVEKMCEFYSRLGKTKYTAIRHSNIYGPHDKYDLDKSHVMGATITKVLTAEGGKIVVWGEGTEKRDLLYVDDLVELVDAALKKQTAPFELVNAGLGSAVSVADLVRKVIQLSGRKLSIEFDKSKPTIPFALALDCAKAEKTFGWKPKTTLDEGIKRTLDWHAENVGGEKVH